MGIMRASWEFEFNIKRTILLSMMGLDLFISYNHKAINLNRNKVIHKTTKKQNVRLCHERSNYITSYIKVAGYFLKLPLVICLPSSVYFMWLFLYLPRTSSHRLYGLETVFGHCFIYDKKTLHRHYTENVSFLNMPNWKREKINIFNQKSN